MEKGLPVCIWPEWKIVEKIGEGSFGKVYKAVRTEGEKTFYSAIKMISIPGSAGELKSIRSESESDQSVREYFKTIVDDCIQEVETMQYFRGNSHVVSVEDYKVMEYLDDIGWDIYIRMEYLTSFLEYCVEKEILEDDIIRLGMDLSKALIHCRQMNIIHRDIKPENVFVSRFGEFKLGDFGIARELEKSVGGLSKKGTYSYMAPEMYRGEQYDYRVDIYSLGIMLYKLRNFNRLPFISLEKQLTTYRDKENALNLRMAGTPLPPPAQAGEAFTSIILKACAFDREDRYQTPEDFYKALEELYYRKIYGGDIDEPDFYNRSDSMKEMEKKESAETAAEKTVKPEEKTQEKEESQPKEQIQIVQRQDNRLLWGAIGILAGILVIFCALVIKIMIQNERHQKQMIIEESLEEFPDIAKDANERDPSEGEDKVARILGGITEGEEEDYGEDVQEVYDHITTIVREKDTFNWYGDEEKGIRVFVNEDLQAMEILIYPTLSEDHLFEEYYYWEGKLIFVYVWDEADADEDEVPGAHLSFKDGKLIHWIDADNNEYVRDESDSEFMEMERKYAALSEKYMKDINF